MDAEKASPGLRMRPTACHASEKADPRPQAPDTRHDRASPPAHAAPPARPPRTSTPPPHPPRSPPRSLLLVILLHVLARLNKTPQKSAAPPNSPTPQTKTQNLPDPTYRNQNKKHKEKVKEIHTKPNDAAILLHLHDVNVDTLFCLSWAQDPRSGPESGAR
ncbi:hypothetical protein K438DRAFT_1776134 [Mycena galopus ATCC 62051]|nr:hypothetical protein K438DRAFT_1776134 [Mycena galopus ATCC 62051]